MDTVSPQQRSRIMAKVRSTGNRSTESVVAAAFRSLRITGWRRQYPVVGTPDFCFPRQRLAVFVDGCFWHGCRKHGRLPATNRRYWEKKIARNVERDAAVRRELRKRGWKVIRVWEHDLREAAALARTMKRIQKIAQPSPASARLAR